MKLVVAIDGPAGAGKSSIAKIVAKKLHYTYIDTGAMYRAVTFFALKENEEITDDLIKKIVANIEISLFYNDDGEMEIIANGENISKEIRMPSVSKNVSKVASLSFVREKMVDLQRKMARYGRIIMDGRDIGTTVLPMADLKIFLTASVEERAKRRFQEFLEKKIEVDFEDLKKDIIDRDYKDENRAISPLKKADDAILLDTTFLNKDEVVKKIINLIEC